MLVLWKHRFIYLHSFTLIYILSMREVLVWASFSFVVMKAYEKNNLALQRLWGTLNWSSSEMLLYTIRILKAFDDFKNKQKSVWSNVFWYVKVCIFWKCIQYTIQWDKTQMFKNTNKTQISFGQNKRYKNFPLFSFSSSNSSQFYF